MRRIAVTCHKGGVGKTTAVVNIAGALRESGARVLLVDCDSQGDLSAVFLGQHVVPQFTVADVFADTEIELTDIVQPTQVEGVFIIPADRRLETVDQMSNFYDDPRATFLHEALREIGEGYDFCLFDTATRPHLSSFAALVASDLAVVPLEASNFSLRAVRSVASHIERARVLNRALVTKYFLSRTKKTKVHETSRQVLQEHLPEGSLLDNVIADLATINTATTLGLPAVLHARNSVASGAWRQLTSELIGGGDVQSKAA